MTLGWKLELLWLIAWFGLSALPKSDIPKLEKPLVILWFAVAIPWNFIF